MADMSDVYAALQAADAAGDTASAQQLADYIRSNGTQAPVTAESLKISNPAEYDPNSQAYQARYGAGANPYWQNVRFGIGQTGHGLLQGLEQTVGLASRSDVAASRALEAPLQNAPGAGVGRVIGGAGFLLPTAFIPGANTLAGAAAIGGGIGAVQPSTSTSETLRNTGFGAAAAPVGILAGRLIGSAYQGLKGIVSPFFKGGQENIAARTLVNAAGGTEEAQAAAARLAQPPLQGLPGYQPTTAEVANNAGLAQLERTLRNNPDYLTQMTTRSQANRAAIVGAVRGVGGTDADIAAAEAARSAASTPLYEAARTASAPMDSELSALLQRPSMQEALKRASRLAAEKGEPLGISVAGEGGASGIDVDHLLRLTQMAPEDAAAAVSGTSRVSGRDLQYLKMSLQDMTNSGFQQGMGSHEVGALRDTLNALNTWTTKNVPELRTADAAFRSASVPVNQLEVGQALTQKLVPALAEFGGEVPARLNANSFASALRNGDQLAAKVTGWKGATLEGTLAPEQMDTLRSAATALASRASADDLGRAVGSNTAQNLISQNMLRQMLGPLGLPQGWAERGAASTIGQTLTRPFQWAGQVGEGRVMGRLAQAALEPQDAAALLLRGSSQQTPSWLLRNQGLFAWPALTYATQQ